jgi:hypothetical protein
VEGSLLTRSTTTLSLIITLMKVGLTVNWPAVHIEPVPVDEGGGGGELIHRSTTTLSLIITTKKAGLTVNWPAMHIEPVPMDGGGGGGELVDQVHHHSVPYNHHEEGWTHR